MPINKIKQKCKNDKFYTKPKVAEHCLDVLLSFVDSDNYFIEPSSGSGSFSDLLPNNHIALDIEPENEKIAKMDFFDFEVPKHSVVVGNPPFGERNTLTKKFIKHSLNAKCIAFVLPSVFCKETLQKVFPENWSLVYNEILPDNSFTFNGKDYHVPCVFQIWLKDDTVHDNLRESMKPVFKTDDFTFTNKEDANCFMFGAAPHKIVEIEEVTCNNRGYWIHASPEIIERLRNIPWKKYALSSVNGGVAWYTKKQILNIYGECYANSKQPKH